MQNHPHTSSSKILVKLICDYIVIIKFNPYFLSSILIL
jgi:hypothetical protein